MPEFVRLDNERGHTQYENVEFVAVFGDSHHVWIDDTHYRETTEDDEISVGDVFYNPAGADKVFRVNEIDEDSALDVQIEYLYTESGETFEQEGQFPKTDEVSSGHLKGEEPETGRQPIPLERVEEPY